MKNNYNVWYPYESFNIGQRFFFFNELINHTETSTSANEKSGADLANEVRDALGKQIGSISTFTNKGMEKIIQVLQFLQHAIEYERGQEKEYYNNYLQKADLPQELKERFNKLFNLQEGEAFDYLEFTNLINILHMGTGKYKTVLNYETNRLHQLQEVIEDYLAHPEEWNAFDKELGKERDMGFYANFNAFITKHNYRNLKNTRTISNALQVQLVKAVEDLWGTNEWRDWVTKKLNDMAFKEPINNNTIMIFNAQLLNVILPELERITFDYLSNNNINKDYNFSRVVIDLNALKSAIRTEAESYVDGLISRDDPVAARKLVEKISQQINSDEINLDNDTKRYLRIVNPVSVTKNKNKEEIVNIAKETETILRSLITNKKQTPKKDKQELIKQFVELYGNPENLEINNKNWNVHEVADLIKTYIPDTKPMIQFHIAAKDNLLSEAFSSGNNEYLKESVGEFILEKMDLAGGYQKADTFGILNKKLGSIIFELDNGTISKNMQALSDSLIKSYMDGIEIVPKNQTIKIEKEIFNESDFRKSIGYADKEFSIEAETERRLIFLKKRCIELKESLKQEGATADQIDSAVTALKDTLQISSTVKSYNKYNNLDGFHGGSLGGSVENQLNNINKMYSYGGIDSFDMDWLIFAVYNSGSNMLGSYLKEPIERILSAAAGMLLFDDAGEQAMYIKSQLENTVSQGSSKFLHLYNLNNFYFPSSYILQLTYNSLLKSYNILEADMQNFSSQSATHSNSTGARIKIENDVQSPPEGANWKDYFSANSGKVSVNIVFLAGMLDIIDQLNSSMQ